MKLENRCNMLMQSQTHSLLHLHVNAALAQTLLQHLAQLGVREVCIAAGARNVPLITALLASRGLKLWNFFEERSAGFFALGRMMHDRRPVAVVTTSGTAAAELLPAVIEAYYQGLPLVLVTADRPSSYRGSGAPQSIEQVGLFGGYTEPTIDFEHGAPTPVWPARLGCKPVHVNICFDEPLTGESTGINFNNYAAPAAPLIDKKAPMEPLQQFLNQRDGLVILAAGLHPRDAEALTPALVRLGVPIIAEATANLAAPALQPLLIEGGEKAFKALQPKRVLRLGSVPSWRWWRDLEQRTELPVMHLSTAPFTGLARQAGAPVPPLSLLPQALQASDQQVAPAPASPSVLADQLAEALAQHPLSEPAWIRQLGAHIPSGARVFLGNSLPIREWNLAGKVAASVSVFANRGANGIDGLVSTFYGLSHGVDETWLIIGDLSALYDLSAPWIIDQLPAANRRIVVINNGGGKIFSRVESLRQLGEQASHVIQNRHARHFEPWAQLWGMTYRRVTTPAELQNLPVGDVLIEVLPDAMQTEGFWQTWAATSGA